MEKSVAQKLLIKPGKRVRVIDPPPDLLVLLGTLPEGAVILEDNAGPDALVDTDVLVLFAAGQKDLAVYLPVMRAALKPETILWVAYHKGTSQIKTDINRDSINAYAQSIGLQGVAMIAIDEDWAALRLKPAA